ncbi:tryptophan halogenase family protein [Cellvibrio mixtus]|uniref:tryptophan halogenase family protein n=1 Tax=Cellvibrio mixtus TaxID=39650 RepID=UPI0005874A00|nr:tryptophan halogenase family protein [Cellvibrio mixtus]
MASRPIKKILIVGGGTAGWMTAAYLARWLENTDIQITLVESEQIGTIGVGEATVPGIHQFIKDLDIKEPEFIRATNATFKLGIEFADWAGQGTHFFHPFAGYGVPIEARPFHKTWWSARKLGFPRGLEQFCLCTQLARSGKFAQPDFDPESRLAWYNYAYHFDASLFAKFLRGYAEQRKVIRIEGKVNHIQLDATSGFIQSISMESGLVIGSDLFVDCTGIPALLINKTLGVGYEDWSKWLLCDSALAVQTKSIAEPDPFTRSSTRTAGWQWHIPLQHRVGNGYVYASQFIAPEQAHQELLANLRGELTTEPKLIRFTTGMRRDFWYKNCVAIGLSSGFLEPLESTSISLIQTGIAKMAGFLIDFEINDKHVAKANRLNRLEYERIRDFIILHYKLNGRSDPFWRHVREMEIPASLAEKIAMFNASGDIKLQENESFKEDSWISMFYGFGIEPRSLEPLTDAEKACIIMDKMQAAIQKGCDYANSHAEFLKTISA